MKHIIEPDSILRAQLLESFERRRKRLEADSQEKAFREEDDDTSSILAGVGIGMAIESVLDDSSSPDFSGGGGDFGGGGSSSGW